MLNKLFLFIDFSLWGKFWTCQNNSYRLSQTMCLVSYFAEYLSYTCKHIYTLWANFLRYVHFNMVSKFKYFQKKKKNHVSFNLLIKQLWVQNEYCI